MGCAWLAARGVRRARGPDIIASGESALIPGRGVFAVRMAAGVKQTGIAGIGQFFCDAPMKLRRFCSNRLFFFSKEIP
jgi:hypothetical protein